MAVMGRGVLPSVSSMFLFSLLSTLFLLLIKRNFKVNGMVRSHRLRTFTSKHFMKKLLLINHANSHHDVKSLTNLSK